MVVLARRRLETATGTGMVMASFVRKAKTKGEPWVSGSCGTSQEPEIKPRISERPILVENTSCLGISLMEVLWSVAHLHSDDEFPIASGACP